MRVAGTVRLRALCLRTQEKVRGTHLSLLLGFDEGRRDNAYPFAPTTLVRGLGGIAVVYAKGTQKTRCMEYF